MSNFKWCNIGDGQPLACDVDDSLTIYKFPEGYASAAENQCWISALFASPESVLSWRDHWDEAENRFRELNPPDGKGSNYLPTRT